MKEVVVGNTALVTGKSGSDVNTTAIIGILLVAYIDILAAQLEEANAKIKDLDLVIADANERLENCGAELQSKEDQVNQVHALLEENQKSKAVLQSESPMWLMICDMASYNIIELDLHLVPPNYLHFVQLIWTGQRK